MKINKFKDMIIISSPDPNWDKTKIDKKGVIKTPNNKYKKILKLSPNPKLPQDMFMHLAESYVEFLDAMEIKYQFDTLNHALNNQPMSALIISSNSKAHLKKEVKYCLQIAKGSISTMSVSNTNYKQTETFLSWITNPNKEDKINYKKLLNHNQYYVW